MAAWRMSMRPHKDWRKLKMTNVWEECYQHGVAAIAYTPMLAIDLSRLRRFEPAKAWAELSGAQKGSFRRVVYDAADDEIKTDDVIYVKQGPLIVCKGVVTGPYQFDKANRILGVTMPWQHQRPVKWEKGFPEITIEVGGSQIHTVQQLTDDDVARIESAVRARRR